MARTVYQEGTTRVTVTGDLEAWARGIFEASVVEAVDVAEAELEEVAVPARAGWYGPDGVTRETGLSGDIQVVTTIDASKGEVIVRVGSVDSRTVQAYKRRNDGSLGDAAREVGGTSKVVAAFVHRPGPNAMVKTQVSHAEYWAAPKALRSNYKPLPANPRTGFPGDTGTGPYIWKVSPKAADGKYLLAELVVKPGRLKVRKIATTLAARIADRIGGR